MYERPSRIHTALFGKHYRALWKKPITVRVFDPHTDSGTFVPVERGGGDQTFSMDVRAPDGCTYSLRSVNKDQAGILPERWQWLPVKSIVRDQASALFPYAPLVCRELQIAAGIYGTHPTLVFVPLTAMAVVAQNRHGYLAWLEVEPDKTWLGKAILGYPEELLNSQALTAQYKQDKLSVDVMAYLKLRLFDILVGDWDRHGKQVEWGIHTISGHRVAYPIAMDRDMAFYRFDDGVLNKVAERVAPKLVSFKPEVKSVWRYGISGRELDLLLLSHLPGEAFEQQARVLQALVDDRAINDALALLPEAASGEAGYLSFALRRRRDQLPEIAREYHQFLTGSRMRSGI